LRRKWWRPDPNALSPPGRGLGRGAQGKAGYVYRPITIAERQLR
jgi:hypothetical protein